MMIDTLGRMGMACLMMAVVLPTMKARLEAKTQEALSYLAGELGDASRPSSLLQASFQSSEPSTALGAFQRPTQQQDALQELPTIDVSPAIRAQLLSSTSS